MIFEGNFYVVYENNLYKIYFNYKYLGYKLINLKCRKIIYILFQLISFFFAKA